MKKALPFEVSTKEEYYSTGTGYLNYAGYNQFWNKSQGNNQSTFKGQKWRPKKDSVVKFFKTPKTYQEEIRGILLGGSLKHEDNFLCSYDLVYCIGRLLFSHCNRSTENDWEAAMDALINTPSVVFEAIEMDVSRLKMKDDFICYQLEDLWTEPENTLEDLAIFAMSNQPKSKNGNKAPK